MAVGSGVRVGSLRFNPSELQDTKPDRIKRLRRIFGKGIFINHPIIGSRATPEATTPGGYIIIAA
jgi:hypothetical protein